MKHNRTSNPFQPSVRLAIHALFMVFCLALASCATPYNVAYFQDMPLEKQVPIVRPTSIRLRPSDKISVLVSTRDAALSQMFSLYSNYSIGNTSITTGNNQNHRSSEYTVNADGTIDFPVLGSLKVAGLTREEVQQMIKRELIDQNLVKDPIITVEFVNLNVLMMGATGVQRVSIDRDQFTILDAITQAGDLDIAGQRENVRVIRETSPSQRVAFEVNLCSAEDLYNSPVYYLQQNDIVYVEPNNKIKRTTTEYGSRMVNYTFWTGILTSALTLIAIFK